MNQGRALTFEPAPFPPDLLRKYIAYARRHIRPILSDDALATIENFYVRIRRQGEEPDAPVPITARQLEALVRLSEAGARARLSPIVETVDAERATQIVEGYLRRVSSTEGKLDIDIVTTGVSHSQRERLEILQGIMRTLQSRTQQSFTIEELKAEAEKHKISGSQTEAIFHTLRNQGEVMETRPGTWQLLRF